MPETTRKNKFSKDQIVNPMIYRPKFKIIFLLQPLKKQKRKIQIPKYLKIQLNQIAGLAKRTKLVRTEINKTLNSSMKSRDRKTKNLHQSNRKLVLLGVTIKARTAL